MQDLTNSFSSSEDKYKQKYLKYKSKYDNLLNQTGGMKKWEWASGTAGESITSKLPPNLPRTRTESHMTPETAERIRQENEKLRKEREQQLLLKRELRESMTRASQQKASLEDLYRISGIQYNENNN